MPFVHINTSGVSLSASNKNPLPAVFSTKQEGAALICNLLNSAGWERHESGEWISGEINASYLFPAILRSAQVVGGQRFFVQIQPDPSATKQIQVKAHQSFPLDSGSSFFNLGLSATGVTQLFGSADSGWGAFWTFLNTPATAIWFGRHDKGDHDIYAWSIQSLGVNTSGQIMRSWNGISSWAQSPFTPQSHQNAFAMTNNLLQFGNANAEGDPSEFNERLLSPYIPPYEVLSNRGALLGAIDGLRGWGQNSAYHVPQADGSVIVYVINSLNVGVKYAQYIP